MKPSPIRDQSRPVILPIGIAQRHPRWRATAEGRQVKADIVRPENQCVVEKLRLPGGQNAPGRHAKWRTSAIKHLNPGLSQIIRQRALFG